MRPLRAYVDKVHRVTSPKYRMKQKYDAELDYWRGELVNLGKWYRDGTIDWWGIRPPTEAQKLNVSPSWVVNAVQTMHALRPSYTEELKIDRAHFAGRKVLEIGNGPLAPIQQFEGCERHCVDPLNNLYTGAGWPLFDYDIKFLSMGAEKLPYPDGHFDAVISVNALDHVDDFEKVSAEMQRVLKPGGEILFEVEYHQPTVTEPLSFDDDYIRRAFSGCNLNVVVNRSGREMFDSMVKRFDLLPTQSTADRFGDERFVTWKGTRKD